MKTLMNIILALSLVCATASLHGQSTAFNFSTAGYAPGTLDGQNGWSVSNFPDRGNMVTGGLSYSNGAVSHNGGDLKFQLISGNRVDLEGPNDETNPVIGEARASIGIPAIAAGSTFYFSYLYNFNADTVRSFYWIGFSNGAANDNNSIAAVAQNANVDGTPTPRLRSRVRDGGAHTQANGSAGTHDLGSFATRLVVGEVFFSGDTAESTIRLWMDPTSLTHPGNTGSFLNAGRNIGINELNTLWIRGDGGAGGETFVDHIMIGDSWDAVVVPEPSTYAALLGLIAIGLVAHKRRRQ